MDWMKIGSALMLIAFLAVMLPRAKDIWRNTPEAGKGDWQMAVIALAGVIGFVLLLMSAV